MEVSQEMKHRTTLRSSNSTFGYRSKGNKISISKSYLYFHVYTIIIIVISIISFISIITYVNWNKSDKNKPHGIPYAWNKIKKLNS